MYGTPLLKRWSPGVWFRLHNLLLMTRIKWKWQWASRSLRFPPGLFTLGEANSPIMRTRKQRSTKWSLLPTASTNLSRCECTILEVGYPTPVKLSDACSPHWQPYCISGATVSQNHPVKPWLDLDFQKLYKLVHFNLTFEATKFSSDLLFSNR